jgi:CheY-like chemotaxis protein
MSTRLNLRNVTSVIVDSDHFTRNLVVQMLRGFGMDHFSVLNTGAEAMKHLDHQCPDLCIVEAMLPDMTSGELVGWMRRLPGPIRFVPTIVLTGYTQMKMVSAARDGGANIVAKKPVSPKLLFDRILWLARAPRPFIEAGDYVGPDRRFQDIEPPDGAYKRDSDAGARPQAQPNKTGLSALTQG